MSVESRRHEQNMAYLDTCMTGDYYSISIGARQDTTGYCANINTVDRRQSWIIVAESYTVLIDRVVEALRKDWRVRTVAASMTPDGHVTPGARYERDDEGHVWRTPFGFGGEALGERIQVEEPHW